jgi:hypothetical protein
MKIIRLIIMILGFFLLALVDWKIAIGTALVVGSNELKTQDEE